MLAAATLGVGGVALLFLPELDAAATAGRPRSASLYALAATAIATGGNVFAVRNHAAGLPVLPTTAWGMALRRGRRRGRRARAGRARGRSTRACRTCCRSRTSRCSAASSRSARTSRCSKVGAGPASYVGVSTPVIAMLLSTLFEGYRWTWPAVLGVALAVAGNVLALRGAQKRPG